MHAANATAPFGEMKATKIIGCKAERGRGCSCASARTDKSFPNAWATARAVLRSIRDPVTAAALLTFVTAHR